MRSHATASSGGPLRLTSQRPVDPLPPVGRTFVAGFESTHLPQYGLDEVDLTGHGQRWARDLDDVLGSGVKHLRYPLRWPRIEPSRGEFDWRHTDRVLGHLRDAGAVPIVDLVHHTSYPGWLTGGFAGADFPSAYLRYAEAVAARYPWLPAYTVFNEPFATLFLAGHEGLWPPYGVGLGSFRELLQNVLPAISEVARCWADLLPDARHVWVDTAEHHLGVGRGIAAAAEANDRRHVLLDLLIGHEIDVHRPFLRRLLNDGGDTLLDIRPLRVDVVGLDYYCHSEWFYDNHRAHAPSPHPLGFAAIAEQYGDRYGLPMMLTETNVRGFASDKVSWLRHMLEEYETALANGVALHGFCWFPHVDSCDWDSLLARCAGRVDPVGVYGLGARSERMASVFTDAWQRSAAGVPVAELPAYRFQEPCATQLHGLAGAMSHWPWQDPPDGEMVPPVPVSLPFQQKGHPMAATDAHPDAIVLSHLRWTWVWQRPQHLVSRFAALRAESGARTWFVEEPVAGDVARPELRTEDCDGVTRVWLVVPVADGQPEFLGFDDPGAREYGELLADLFAEQGRPSGPDVWLYSPMAFDIAQTIRPGRLIYDVMDDLASFKNAPIGMMLRQRRTLTAADVVFTGGRSLHQGVTAQRRNNVHLFPSGVDTDHYRSARLLRRPHSVPVAGYVGVVDERIDLDLLAGLAELLPDWTIRVVGPIAKIDPSALPTAPNIDYVGMTKYEALPEMMAGFDVALMPFALNEATRSISPTKTLEYLAAGLPVVSTRVHDVVTDYFTVVDLADDAEGFAAACRRVLEHDRDERDRLVRPLLARQEWDAIAAAMHSLVVTAGGRSAAAGVDTDEAEEASA